MAFITANIDYVGAAKQVREDDGLTSLINALSEAYGSGTFRMNLLSQDDEELTPEAKEFLRKLNEEAKRQE